MKRLHNRYRWTLLLASSLLPVLATAAPAGPAAGSVAADGGALSVLDDAGMGGGVSMGVGDDLYLEVVVNQQPTGQLAHFGNRDGQLWASLSTLRKLGFILPAGSPDPMPLQQLAGAIVNYDAASQRVNITVPLSMLDREISVLNTDNSNTIPTASASPGLLLNYDLYGTTDQHNGDSLSALTELRAFGMGGVFSNTSLSQTSQRNNQSRRSGSTRLETSWQTSFPQSMLTMKVGDTLTGSLGWSRSTHIAGVQFSRDFSLQPYRITTPVPAFFGQAALPSAVDLYINGIKQYSGKVEPGPYKLNSAPTINGSGQAQVVLTDALGRSNSVDFSFYTSDQLLAQGLSDWSAEVGVVRQNYGLKSFDYGHDPAASGIWRYGVSDSFTAQAHGEATAGLALAGAGGTVLLGDSGGVLSSSLAESSAKGRHGTLYNLGYQWRRGPFNISLNSTRTHGQYRDVASLYGAAPPQVSEQAVVGLNTTHLGSFSLSYLHLRYSGSGANNSIGDFDPFDDTNDAYDDADSRYASTFWFQSVGRGMSISMSANQNLHDRRDRSFFLGFSMSLDSRTTLSTSAQHSASGNTLTIDANHSVPSNTGFGWRAQARSGSGQNGGMAEGDYRGNYGEVRAGVNVYGDSRYVYADGSGALVLMGGNVFAARHLDQAFAVVSTDGIADVPVKLENRLIGKTNRNGVLLVTPLNAWQNNKLAIDPMDLPATVRIDHVKTLATPTQGAGTLVKFGIHPVRAASIILHNAAGKPIPVGSTAQLQGQSNQGAMIGFDGALYLDTLQDHNTLEVTTPDGVCRVRFDDPTHGDDIPEIGPLTCTESPTP